MTAANNLHKCKLNKLYFPKNGQNNILIFDFEFLRIFKIYF